MRRQRTTMRVSTLARQQRGILQLYVLALQRVSQMHHGIKFAPKPFDRDESLGALNLNQSPNKGSVHP